MLIHQLLHKNHLFLLLLLTLGLLSSCTTSFDKQEFLPPPPGLGQKDSIDAKTGEPQDQYYQSTGDATYKLGKPYKVNGVWYFPAENMKYDEIGYAGLYDVNTTNSRTANGEIYQQDRLTASHKTLPLPSIARITNLDNNNSVIVRINDRGPFSNDRLIDVSTAVAKRLEFAEGPSKVRITVLPDETKHAIELLSAHQKDDRLLRIPSLSSGTMRPENSTEESDEKKKGTASGTPILQMVKEQPEPDQQTDSPNNTPDDNKNSTEKEPQDGGIDTNQENPKEESSSLGNLNDKNMSPPSNESANSQDQSEPLDGDQNYDTDHITTGGNPAVNFDTNENSPNEEKTSGDSPEALLSVARLMRSSNSPQKASSVSNTDSASDSDQHDSITTQSLVKTSVKAPTKEASAVALKNGGYYIQAGSFGVKKNATNLSEKISKFAHSEIIPSQSKNRVLNRVQVGPFSTKDAAEQALSRIKNDMGLKDAKLLKR